MYWIDLWQMIYRESINSKKKLVRLIPLCCKTGIIVLALLPIINILRIAITTGANNPSNDLIFYLPLIDQVLRGTYNWQNYLTDTFIRSHSLAFPVLIRLAIVRLTHWNIYAELYIGIFLAVLRVLLLHNCLKYPNKQWLNWLLWPLLSALVFSTSQINAFTYGDTSLAIGLSHLGFVLGIWGLVRFPNRLLGAIIVAIGGILAAWSWGLSRRAWWL